MWGGKQLLGNCQLWRHYKRHSLPACSFISLVESCEMVSGHVGSHPKRRWSDLEGHNTEEEERYANTNLEHDPHTCPDYTGQHTFRKAMFHGSYNEQRRGET